MSNISQNGYYIYVTAADTTTGTLTLSDNGVTTILDHGADIDSVFWIVNDNIPNIQAITGINLESNVPGNTNIFSGGPNPITLMEGQKSAWGATFAVGGTVPVNSVEVYSISWKDTDNKNHTYDPKMVVNP